MNEWERVGTARDRKSSRFPLASEWLTLPAPRNPSHCACLVTTCTFAWAIFHVQRVRIHNFVRFKCKCNPCISHVLVSVSFPAFHISFSLFSICEIYKFISNIILMWWYNILATQRFNMNLLHRENAKIITGFFVASIFLFLSSSIELCDISLYRSIEWSRSGSEGALSFGLLTYGTLQLKEISI